MKEAVLRLKNQKAADTDNIYPEPSKHRRGSLSVALTQVKDMIGISKQLNQSG